MTNNIKYIGTLSAAAALALVAGCNKMATTGSPTGFPEDGVVRIAANSGELQTRADGNSESEYTGTTLGLFIDYGSGDKYTEPNVKWSKSEADWTPEKMMLWKNSTAAAKIYAYAPYVDAQTDPVKVEFSIPADQTGGTLAADLVTWPKGDFIPDNTKNNDFSTDGKILISFSHRLVKLTFNFEKGTQFGSDVTVSEAVLLGTASKVVCDITKTDGPGKAGDATSLDIKLHKVSDLKWEGIFCPGDGQQPDAKMLKVTMSDGTILNYVVPAGGLVSSGFMSGTAYEMNMRLGKDKIELVKDGISVGGWTDSSAFFPDEGGEAQIDPNADVWDGTAATFKETDGSKTLGDSEAEPILIESAAQLAYLAQQVNAGTPYQGKYFKLTKDIALADKPWTPIGGYAYVGSWEERPFEGNFDGGNHTIYGLKVVAEKDGENNPYKRSGLFGIVNESSGSNRTYIKNLKIIGANVLNENQYSGILCGTANRVDVSGVEVRGNVTASGMCGGLVGLANNSAIKECKAKVKVTSTGSAGGICAESVGLELSGCSVSSSEVVGTVQTGGLLGIIYDKIDVKDCTVDASLKANGVGGLFGCFNPSYNKTRSAQNCTMTGTITVVKGNGDEYGGGIVGGLFFGSCSFENCGFDGTVVKEEGVDANKERVGAAIGKDDIGTCTFTSCWYNVDKISGLYKIGGGKDNANYSGIEEKHLGK